MRLSWGWGHPKFASFGHFWYEFGVRLSWALYIISVQTHTKFGVDPKFQKKVSSKQVMRKLWAWTGWSQTKNLPSEEVEQALEQ
jgi:hypothetical protein